jgi:flavin reductase (DIM6/NTAB) family NADH-FMN oxidoreductase RutF
MPVQSGEPVGPIPEGAHPVEYDKLRRRVLWKFPSGLYIIGSRHGDRRNAMTASWVTQVSFEPKLIAVSVEKEALTHELILAGGAYAVNLIARDDRAIVRKFTKPVTVDDAERTLNEFPFSDAPATGMPILDQAVAFVECRVHNAVDVGGSTLFISEVVNLSFQAAEETDVLRMEDTRMSYGG